MISRRQAVKRVWKATAFGIFVPELIRAQTFVPGNPRKPLSSSQTCSLWTSPIDQEQGGTPNDYWTTAPLAQKLKITASGTICKAQLLLSRGGADETVNLGFWSDSGGTATQTGTTSNNVVINVANGSAAYLDFTWSVNPVLTADIFMVLKNVTSNGFRWLAITTAGLDYQDAITYTAFENTNARLTSDFNFKLWTLQ